MNEEEIKKCKNDAVYFVEKSLGIKLLPWQKLYLRAFQSERIFRVIGRTSSKKVLYDSMITYEKFLSELDKE